MIQFDNNGVTLYYVGADGQRVSHNYLEGAAYSAMLAIRDAQLQAARENTLSANNYKTVLAQIQKAVDDGKPHDAAPVKPNQKVVSDTGEISYAPFVPALPDLVVPTTKTPVGIAPAPVVDTQPIMYNMILAIFRKMFPEA